MKRHGLVLLAALVILASCGSESENTRGGTGGAGTGGTSGGTAGGAGVGAGALGAANAAGPGSEQDLQQNVGDRVFFATDQSTIDPEGRKTLERQAQWLGRYPNVTITVEGHCDERGTREYNLALGERRAAVVKQLLVSLGISSNRVQTITYGKERPAVTGSTDSAWAQNRRGVTVVN